MRKIYYVYNILVIQTNTKLITLTLTLLTNTNYEILRYITFRQVIPSQKNLEKQIFYFSLI